MTTVNYLHVIKGEGLEEAVCNLINKQVIFEKPGQVTIRIFRNDERKQDKFGVEIIIPGGEIHTISRHKTLDEARIEYNKLTRGIESGEKKMKISMVERLTVSIV